MEELHQILADPAGKMNLIVHGVAGCGKSAFVNAYRRYLFPEEKDFHKYSKIFDVKALGYASLDVVNGCIDDFS